MRARGRPDAASRTSTSTDHARFAERVPHEMFAVLRREDPVHWQEETRRPRVLGDHPPRGHHGGRQGLAHLLVRARRHLAAGPRARGARGSQVDARHGPAAPQRAARDRQPRLHPARGARVHRADPRALRRVLDEALEKGEVEFVDDVAAKLPMRVFAEMLGAPEGRPPLPGRARRPDARPGRSRVRDRPRGGGGEPPPAVLQPGGARDVRVRPQARRRAARVPARRHRHQARRGRDRRLPADPARVRRLLPAARRRRQRDHPPLDLLRCARADREPRAARSGCAKSPS